MRFYGSAMPMPHIQGAFRQRLVAESWQCHKIADGVSINEAALAEPFAVTLHAVQPRRRRCWASGCWSPAAGRSARLAIIAARAHGAREIVATDVMDGVLAMARDDRRRPHDQCRHGCPTTRRLQCRQREFRRDVRGSGNERAVRAGLEVLKPRGVLVQLGLGGDISIPQNMIVAKEIEMRGTFRFHEEFALAVDLINRRRVDLKPLLTGVYTIDEAVAAFEIAGDRNKSMKVQIAF